MAESNHTTEGGTPSSESAQSTSAKTETAASDVVVGTELAQAQEGDTLAATKDDISAAEPNSIIGARLPGDADKLRLADLLQSEHDGNLDALLTFTSDGTDTTLHVNAGATLQEVQDIVLQGVGDLTAGGARSSSAIIADLLMQGALGTDGAG